MKRSRGRNRRSGGNNNNSNHSNPNRHYESVGPDVKIRGSAQQVLEKYQQYARDAHTSGDRVLSEAYHQFAEHYQRIVTKQNDAKERQQQRNSNERDGRRDHRNENRNYEGDENANKSDAPTDEPAKFEDDASPREHQPDEAPSTAKAEPAPTDDAVTVDAEEKPRKPTRTRRKPYKAKTEDGAELPDADDGVRKTLARGRRKKAPEAAEAGESTSETTAE